MDLGGFSDGTVPAESVEYRLAQALAAAVKGVYGYQSWRLKQQFPDSAEDTYFWRWAGIFGIFQKAAEPWRGTYTFTGTNGSVIDAGTELQRPDGQLYTTDASGVISGGEVTVAITASEAGAAANNEVGQELQLSSNIAGVDTDGTVESSTATGSDLEEPEDALARLAIKMAGASGTGAEGDYVQWALEVAGVTRAWEFPLLAGPNSVSVAFVRDDDGTGSDIVPDSTERDAVAAHLEEVRPITVTVEVITLAAQTVDIQFSELNPDTAAVKDAIAEAVADLFLREAAPGGTIALSQIAAAISGAAGEVSHVLTLPAADVVSTTSQIPIVGTVTVVP